MSRIPQPDPFAVARVYPSPAPADYSDEVSEEILQALEKVVKESDTADDLDNLEVIDGPAW